MNREIIAVYDIEPEFASRFVSYLKSKYEERYDMYAFTELTALLEFVEKHRADMLIISQKSIECVDNPIVPDNLNVKRVVILSENCCDSYMDYKAVEKYRPADIVFREAVECAYEKKVETGEVKETVSDKEIIGVYSPVNRCMKTTFSLTLSNLTGENRRVLYINFEEYSGLKKLLNVDYVGDLSDLVYYFLQDEESIKSRIYGIRREYKKFDFIPPMMFSNDIRNMDMEMWVSFINAVSGLEMYDTIVLDISDMMQDVTEILRICDCVYMPMLKDDISQAKISEFEERMYNRHEDSVLAKIRKFIINPEEYITDYADGMGRLINGRFKEFVREITGGAENRRF